MAHEERHADDLLVHAGALLAHAMRARHLAMIGREDDNGAIGLAGSFERVEDKIDIAVHIVDAVVIIVAMVAPAGLLLLRQETVHDVGKLQVAAVGDGLRFEIVGKAFRQIESEPFIIERRGGRGQKRRIAQRIETFLRHRPSGVVEHDVVGVDEIHRHEPGLAAFLAAVHAEKPVRGVGGDGRVVLEAVPAGPVMIAVMAVVGETPGLEGAARFRTAGAVKINAVIDVRQMPLALVSVMARSSPVRFRRFLFCHATSCLRPPA